MAEKHHAYCPECDTRIRFKKQPKIGQLTTCPECLERLEVVSTRPLEVDWALEDDGFSSDSYDSNGYDEYETSDWEDNWR